MNRRKFILSCSAAVPGLLISNRIESSFFDPNKEIKTLDDDYFKKLADTSIRLAKASGASYSDFRVSKYRNQRIFSRETNIESVSDNEDYGFSVRLLIDGAWGFAASSTITEKEVEKITSIAADISKANRKIQLNPVELASVKVYNDYWETPVKKNPFDVSIEEKINLLLGINNKALELGANYCSSFIWSVNEWKYFASSEGSYIKQNLFRIWPGFEVTIVDKESGKFETRNSLTAPIGKGYDYVEDYDFMADLEKAVEETKAKFKAKSVESGKRDIILDPTHLWLTIHESCGHPSELDRALGYEANYAGTSFLTVDKLGKLQYGSNIVNLVADRTQKDGLATRGYDDDGVKTTQWNIIKNGIFVGYQTTREMAKKINQKESNGCAYSDSWSHFPIQRMPNVSLEPGSNRLSLKDLIADTEDGIYIVGDGSWSIDMQRYNFQFTGQAFYEIKNGEIVGLLRDVAYQGNTVDFWNSCDAICDESEYKLGGSFFCGKGEPGQVSPVSHGSSPARFRKVNILNTSKESAK
jgi:TldD protein